ncbi:MAG: GNAT family N-acetyltransferase [Candidatus Bathyarchaeia archaeon]|jgi:GNAT superfamily N-acetyltransferase
MVKKMQNTLDAGNRVISNGKRKLAGLLRIIFGRIFAYEEMIVLETSSQTNLKSLAACAWLKSVGKSKVDVRLADNTDTPKFDRFQKFRGGKAGERLKAGHLCFIAEKNGKIINYTWVAFHEAYIDEIERKIIVSPCSAYGYDEYTDPEYRGMGVFPMVLGSTSDYLFQNGIKEIYELVSSNNFPSLRSHQKMGSRKMGEITLVRLFNSRRYRCKGETPEDLYKLKEMFSI